MIKDFVLPSRSIGLMMECSMYKKAECVTKERKKDDCRSLDRTGFGRFLNSNSCQSIFVFLPALRTDDNHQQPNHETVSVDFVVRTDCINITEMIETGDENIFESFL
jgi:hypothetical protein